MQFSDKKVKITKKKFQKSVEATLRIRANLNSIFIKNRAVFCNFLPFWYGLSVGD
jgi:hypothetical protein